ncbi:MAG: hypothetical protein H6559_10525 [Lewinellaceae bacterium]|nr:hypothetical protein [Lewinellaceae bacterium]
MSTKNRSKARPSPAWSAAATTTSPAPRRSRSAPALRRYQALLYHPLPAAGGALREFLNNAPPDGRHHALRVHQKTQPGSGTLLLVGIQVQKREDYEELLQRMDEHRINYQTLNDQRMLFDLLV